MNKAKQREIEQRIRSMEEPPYSPSDERIEEIKQKAFDEYERILQAREEKKTSHHKSRGVLRRVVAVAALSVFLLIFPLVYTALMPVTVANANHLVRRAAIWINNQFHLGITFSDPVDDEDKAVYAASPSEVTIADLERITNIPILYFPETDELKIKSIVYERPAEQMELIHIQYEDGDDILSIMIYSLFEQNTIGLLTSEMKELTTSQGTIYVYSDDAYSYAKCILDGSVVTITSSHSTEWIEDNCGHLCRIN